MGKIASVQTNDRALTQIQDNIQKALAPTLTNPLTYGIFLTEIELSTGSNTVNHTLNRKLQGWFIVRQRASASIYDTQDDNSQPSISLLLTSSADVTVDLYVF